MNLDIEWTIQFSPMLDTSPITTSPTYAFMHDPVHNGKVSVIASQVERHTHCQWWHLWLQTDTGLTIDNISMNPVWNKLNTLHYLLASSISGVFWHVHWPGPGMSLLVSLYILWPARLNHLGDCSKTYLFSDRCHGCVINYQQNMTTVDTSC